MPFRAGNGTKELFMFQSYAKQREKKHRNKKLGNDKFVDDHHDSVPIWVPGFVLFALPGQPEWMLDLDFAFWANLLYIAGSVIYVAQGLYFWHYVSHCDRYNNCNGVAPMTEYDDYNPNNPSNYLNLIGAAIFIGNALASFVDWWLCSQQSSIMNLSIEDVGDEQTEGKFKVQDMGDRILNLYLWNNIFFLFAAITWLVGGVWLFDKDTDTMACREGSGDTLCFTFWVPFVATFCYLLSSLCGIWEFFETAKFRKAQDLPPLPLFSFDFYKIDWFGWGDLLYFVASAIPFAQSFVNGFALPSLTDDKVTDDTLRAANAAEHMNYTVGPIYNTSNFIFLIDSLAYMVGYVLFIYEIIATMQKRHDEEEAEHARHGNIDHLHSSRESFVRRYGDDDDDGRFGFEPNSAEASSTYVTNAVNKMMLRRENTIVHASSPGQRRGSASGGSGHGSAIMNSVGRSSFTGQPGRSSFSGGSPGQSGRSSFSGGAPGQPGRLSFSGGYPGQIQSDGDSGIVLSPLASPRGSLSGRRSFGGGGGDAPMPPVLSAVQRAPSIAYR